MEGKDEVNLFEALIKRRFGDDKLNSVQIIDAGGKDQFSRNLTAVKSKQTDKRSWRVIGIVRDADSNSEHAFQSVCDAMKRVGYTPPEKHAIFRGDNPILGVFIVPDGCSSGSVKTLCRRSVKHDMISHCVDDYLTCLDKNEVRASTNVDKSFVHAYLAAKKNPAARVGEGARQGVWDFDSDSFAGLSNFISDLLEA